MTLVLEKGTSCISDVSVAIKRDVVGAVGGHWTKVSFTDERFPVGFYV